MIRPINPPLLSPQHISELLLLIGYKNIYDGVKGQFTIELLLEHILMFIDWQMFGPLSNYKSHSDKLLSKHCDDPISCDTTYV